MSSAVSALCMVFSYESYIQGHMFAGITKYCFWIYNQTSTVAKRRHSMPLWNCGFLEPGLLWCNTGRSTLSHNQSKPLINSGLIKKRMIKASLRMRKGLPPKVTRQLFGSLLTTDSIGERVSSLRNECTGAHDSGVSNSEDPLTNTVSCQSSNSFWTQVYWPSNRHIYQELPVLKCYISKYRLVL
jgi:hypothetical protein